MNKLRIQTQSEAVAAGRLAALSVRQVKNQSDFCNIFENKLHTVSLKVLPAELQLVFLAIHH